MDYDYGDDYKDDDDGEYDPQKWFPHQLPPSTTSSQHPNSVLPKEEMPTKEKILTPATPPSTSSFLLMNSISIPFYSFISGKTFGDSFSNVDYDYGDDYEGDDDEEYDLQKWLPPPPPPATSPATSSSQHPNSVLPKAEVVTTERAKKKSSDPNDPPEFVLKPVDSYIIRGKSARLKCGVTGAGKVYFVCNGEAMAESNLHREKDFVGEDGKVVKEVVLEVSRNNVEEIFGTFTCTCDAWYNRGKISTEPVTVENACK